MSSTNSEKTTAAYALCDCVFYVVFLHLLVGSQAAAALMKLNR